MWIRTRTWSRFFSIQPKVFLLKKSSPGECLARVGKFWTTMYIAVFTSFLGYSFLRRFYLSFFSVSHSYFCFMLLIKSLRFGRSIYSNKIKYILSSLKNTIAFFHIDYPSIKRTMQQDCVIQAKKVVVS